MNTNGQRAMQAFKEALIEGGALAEQNAVEGHCVWYVTPDGEVRCMAVSDFVKELIIYSDEGAVNWNEFMRQLESVDKSKEIIVWFTAARDQHAFHIIDLTQPST